MKLGSVSSYRDLWVNTNSTQKIRKDGSNVDLLYDAGEEGLTLPVCHLIGLVPFQTGNYKPYVIGFEDTASIALAVQHLNTGDGSIVPEVTGLSDRCPVRFSMEMAETAFDGGTTLNTIQQLHGRTFEDSGPKPCAFIGPYRSAVSQSSSVLNGVYGYPQVSPGSSAPVLDDKTQYPLSARTVPSEEGRVSPLLKYLTEVLGLTKLAVVYTNDSLGNGFIDSLRKLAETEAPNLDIFSVPISFKDGQVSNVVEAVKSTGYRYIYCVILSAQNNDEFMLEAYRQGIAGNGGYNWMYTAAFGGVATGRSFKIGSPLQLVYQGTAIVWVKPGVDGFPAYDSWRDQMRSLRNEDDQEVLESLFVRYDSRPSWYNNSYLAFKPDYLDVINHGFTGFAYEATIALGLSACNAYDQETGALSGWAHFDELRTSTFRGIGGVDILFDNVTGTRDPQSTIFEVANFVAKPDLEDPSSIVFESQIASVFLNGTWQAQRSFVYNHGGNIPPPDFVVGEENFLSDGIRAMGFTLLAVAWFLALASAVGVWVFRHKSVVQVSQPTFQLILSLGAAMIAVCIYTLSLDESQGYTDAQLDFACKITPWFFFVGHICIFSSLFCKLWRLNKVLQFAKRKVTAFDALGPLVVLMTITITLLTVWTVVDPWVWTREMISLVPAESYGQCQSENFMSYFGPLAGLMVISEIMTIFIALKSDDIPDNLRETRQILWAIATQVQAWIVGVPILAVLGESSADATFCARVILVWIFSVTSVGIVVLPKVYAAAFNRPTIRSGKNPRHLNISSTAGSSDRVHISGLNYCGEIHTQAIPQETPAKDCSNP